MIDVAGQWNPKQALLKELLQRTDRFDAAVELCLEMHSFLHTSEMSGVKCGTYEDVLWKGLDEKSFRIMPTASDVTIAWNLWHLTRIEDLTVNILIADDTQVINQDRWLERMGTNVRDTGNAMTDDEIMEFSDKVDMMELRNYRIAVGRRTREVLKSLECGAAKKKVAPDRLQRILEEGGVLESTRGLLEFWGKKSVAGILQMPVTRHQIVHLNDSFKIKQKLQGKQTRCK